MESAGTADRAAACLFLWPLLAPLLLILKAGDAGDLDRESELSDLQAEVLQLKQEREELRLKLLDAKAKPPQLRTYG